MKTTEKTSVTDTPKENNDHTSHPKDPNNDPDQTPEKEVQDPPQSKPGKEEPSKQPNKIGFKEQGR